MWKPAGAALFGAVLAVALAGCGAQSSEEPATRSAAPTQSASAYRDCSRVQKAPGADLSSCNLREAELRDANLSGANLTNADLYRANLSAANLTNADLTGASLFKATLINATLINATLSNADLSGARWVDRHVCARGSIGRCK